MPVPLASEPTPAARSMLLEANRRWPARRKDSDGLLPSPEHYKANPDSDHNDGYAVDLTHDPAHGVDTYILARQLADHGDARVKYIISNRQIFTPGEGWVAYHGSDPHTNHMHVSILHGHGDDTHEWFSWMDSSAPVGPAPATIPPPSHYGPPCWGWSNRRGIVQAGDVGDDVKHVQGVVGVAVDGYYGADTYHAVWSYQAARRLTPDGVVGPATWHDMGVGVPQAPRVMGKPDHYGDPVWGWSNRREYIGLGCVGDDVKRVQLVLGLSVDGYYGPATHAAVWDLQDRNHQDPSGTVGPRTWALLGYPWPS
jgi:peptidoglycan hydrolase-like protein with peptidoglycan-binding domain